MKRFFAGLFALVLTLGALAGCAAEKPEAPKEVTVDSSFVILCPEEPELRQAALSLQTTLSQRTALSLEVVAETESSKTITIAVDPTLSLGQYRTRLTENGIVLEAQSRLVLIMAMRSIRQSWLVDGVTEGAETVTLTAEQCPSLSGIIDPAAAPFLVLTQNIRYTDDEGGNLVVQRAPRFKKLVEQYQPDILCMQEDNYLWVPILEAYFGDRYGFHGMYGDGPDVRGGKGGNKQLILYRTDRYELLEEGGFWLSNTPEKASKLITSKGTRTCTWVLLKDKLTGQTLFVCNAHLDTQNEQVRLAQLDILLTQVGSYIEQYPAIFCGDYNARPDSGVYAEMTRRFSDPHVTATTKLSDAQHTYTKYGTDEDPRRLDYLFYNAGFTADSYCILTDQYSGYISDHFGAMTQFTFVQ